jgi:nucleoside 2-deoxyribosyltransferase
MKIAICSSMVFTEKMIEIQQSLNKIGHEACISIFANAYIGKTVQEKEEITIYHKNEKDAIRKFWKIIKTCDAILVLNYTRRGIENYIGGNTFLEMGFAHVLNKKIFLMNPIPDVLLYKSEIEAMKPEIIYQDITRFGNSEILTDNSLN